MLFKKTNTVKNNTLREMYSQSTLNIYYFNINLKKIFYTAKNNTFSEIYSQIALLFQDVFS